MEIFPLEIVEKISKDIHRERLRDVHNQLKYCVTWVYADKIGTGYCFIVSNNQNYYAALLENESQDWVEKKYVIKKS